MPTLTTTQWLPQPRERVWAWHGRAGAFTRLAPPGLITAPLEDASQLSVGAEREFRVRLFGLPLSVRWTARHTVVDPPAGFDDVMVRGPMRSWTHHHRFSESGAEAASATTSGTTSGTKSGTKSGAEAAGGTVVDDVIDYELPAGVPPRVAALVQRRLRAVLAYRGRQLRDDLAFHDDHRTRKTVLVGGASGLVGRQLVAFLRAGGHEVRVLTRAPSRATSKSEVRWDPSRSDGLEVRVLDDVDVVVHLGGEPIGRRFTAAHRAAVLDSRVRSTGLLAAALARLAGDGRARSLVVASASGFYGAGRGDEVLTEADVGGDDFLSLVCRAWEAAADPARHAGVRVAHLRTGFVQSAGGGQLALQLPLFEAGLGGPLGTGRQWMPWITIDDLVGLYAHVALTEGLAGPVNAAAPHPVRASEYADVLAGVLGRRARLPVPEFGPALLLGRQGARELALAGQRLDAARALAWGYHFRHTDLAGGLRHVLAR